MVEIKPGGKLVTPSVWDLHLHHVVWLAPGGGPTFASGHLGVHQFDRRLDVAGIERAVGLPQDPLSLLYQGGSPGRRRRV